MAEQTPTSTGRAESGAATVLVSEDPRLGGLFVLGALNVLDVRSTPVRSSTQSETSVQAAPLSAAFTQPWNSPGPIAAVSTVSVTA